MYTSSLLLINTSNFLQVIINNCGLFDEYLCAIYGFLGLLLIGDFQYLRLTSSLTVFQQKKIKERDLRGLKLIISRFRLKHLSNYK